MEICSKRINNYVIIGICFSIVTLSDAQVQTYSKVIKSSSVNSDSYTNNEDSASRVHRTREGVLNSNLWFPAM